MAIFGRPDFQGDFNSLFPQGNSAAGTPDELGGMPGAPPWLNNPLAFLMSALQQGSSAPANAVPGILGGLGRGAPTGPATPAFGMQGSVDPTGSSGVPPTTPLSGGMGLPPTPTPPRQPPIPGFDPTQPAGIPLDMSAAGGGEFPKLPSIPPITAGAGPLTDPMTGLEPGQKLPSIVSALGNVPAPQMSLTGAEGGPELPVGPFGKEPNLKVPSGFGKLTGKDITGATPPPTEFGDWTPPGEEAGTVPGQPLPPFNKTMPAKTGPVPGSTGGTYTVPAGGTAGPEARIQVTPEQRKHMIQTVLGEAGDEPQKGKEAVAHVIINRALENKKEFGGSDVSAVIQKPYQFEPWNTPAGRAKMAGYPTTSKDYKNAEKAVDDAISGKADPTGGSTYFYSPVGQSALGRAKPNWATKDRFATKIGGHDFYYGATGQPLPPPAGTAEGEVVEPPAAVPPGTVDTSGRVTPQPPQLPMPPGQAQTPRTDYSAVRAMLDKAGYITPGENMANVLAGLARGAGSVASNSPGSFAAALAAAGAGGEGAFASGLKEGRQAIGARAAAEIPLLGTEREQAKDYTAVEFQNATAKYGTLVQNLNNDFAGRKQEFSFLQPDIKFDANGMHVSRYNPQTGQVEIQNVPLRDKMQQYESLSAMAKSLGMEHPYVRMKLGQMMLDEMAEELRPGFLKQLIVSDVISDKAGGSVFGDDWTKALKQAEKQIPPEMRSKPAEYEAMREAIAKSIILNSPSINNPSWIASAAKSGSPFAAWLLPQITPQKATPKKKQEEQDFGY